jgi:cyclic beta-1,2-glucan synthetase
LKNASIKDLLSHLRLSLPGDDLMRKYANEEAPFRRELFSADQMAQHGRALAARHQLTGKRTPNELLKRLADNEDLLLEVNDLLTNAIKDNRRIIPAGEWLLDNFYLIQEQIRTGKKHLPKGYSEDLPQLSNGPSAGLPRVYDIALEIVAHSDGRVDLQGLSQFIAAYQEVNQLKLGELWAIPIMLRLSLIENLRRLAARIALDRIHQNLADYWAEKMIETAESDPSNLILVIADMARSSPPMVSSFIAELTRMLQGKGPALALPLTWIEQRLAGTGQTGNELVQAEFQSQAANQVSMSNSIGSLRALGTIDWRDFVETNSFVEQNLREDASGVYPQMDFITRDHYRHIVEKISRYSPLSELGVSAIVIKLASESAEKNGGDHRMSHVGYYLIGKGLRQAEKEARMALPPWDQLEKLVRRHPLLLYVLSLALITGVISGGFIKRTYLHGIHGGLLVLVGILSILCASQLAVTLINWMVTLLIHPRLLPRMDYSKGIPEGCRSLVIIPTLFANEREFEDLLEQLEVRYLANRDERLHFGLLTDFPDAQAETLPQDAALLSFAKEKVETLNDKYGSPDNQIFFLFHRPRRWNAQDQLWMGYERKRGKLSELNSLLRGDGAGYFSLIVGEPSLFSSITYVITLDTDTQLPRDSAWKIIAAMSHPLNRAVYDEKKQRVTEGYGILQPRVDNSLAGTVRSRYARLHGSDTGIDPYTLASSDVYQDLFNEGSFIGKGIYEVDIFAKGLNGRFPENRILSHDLLEGCYIRSGLLTDVQLYEEYPASYSADVKRRHRWIRGDWQVGTWFMPFVPGEKGKLRKNPLSTLSRWKIFDNLRRSLIPSGLIFLLLLGWTALHDEVFWTVAVVLLIIVAPLSITVWNILNKPKEASLRQHIGDSIQSITNYLIQTAFTIVCLPYEAYYTLDAIVRTNWRIVISHKKLLEWSPSGYSNGGPGNLPATFQTMWAGPVLGVMVFSYLLIVSPINVITTFILLGCWFASPAIAWWFSIAPTNRQSGLDHAQVMFLRQLARKTWSFFETFVGEEDNWLPPDNYQEHPAERTAHRTSPTNMGLALLADLAAWDFGYCSSRQFIKRSTRTLDAMNRLERFRGHFYNWYDTVSMQPLPPRYVSTVDSGNLVGHLLVLRQGMLDMPHRKIWDARMLEGLRDTAGILEKIVKENLSLILFRNQLEAAILTPPGTAASIRQCLQQLEKSAAGIQLEFLPGKEAEAQRWAEALTTQVRQQLEDIIYVWKEDLPTDETPTLHELAAIPEKGQAAAEQILMLEQLAEQCLEFTDVEYDFLFDRAQKALTIGYNVEEHRRDGGFYDLLASEARLGIFAGIAQGKLPQEVWFALGRQLTNAGGASILVSWSGSMFEYLMPLLVMPEYDNTLLDQTNKSMIERQVEYGDQRSVPWGISESGYNLVDAHLNYQYRAFGVPGLGLKRGLAEDLVIAPYASVMALMVAPEKACDNIQQLTSDGYEGRYGLYEAIDYTASRLPRGQANVVIRSFMVHHQGMSLLALAYALLGRPMQKRFESELRFQATLLLLQERIPKATGFYAPPADIPEVAVDVVHTHMRVINTPDTPVPEVQLLSNGKYNVMITNAGGGYSRWKDIAVTRWQEDNTCDNWGNFCYIRDIETAAFWSAGHQPTLRQAKSYEAVFSQGRAEFRRRDNDIETHTEIVVSPEDDIEMRRIHLTNRSRRKRTIEITSYAEVVLTSNIADALHPAFSKLFVQTEILPGRNAILCTRRPRSAKEQSPWMFHLMKMHGAEIVHVSYETDRMAFIGRGNTLVNPRALYEPALSGTEGPVLDPIVAIRYQVTLNPQESITADMVFGMAETREAAMGLVEKYQDRHLADRAIELAWTHSQVILRQINASEADAQLYARLAGSIIYANASLRADPALLVKNQRGQSGLWSYSISGDLPIALVQIEDAGNIELVKQMIQAHAYWRLKGLTVDLVIWNEDHGGYRQLLQNQLLGLISAGIETDLADRPGGIFIRVADQISIEDRILLQTVARVIISDGAGDLDYQIGKRSNIKTQIPRLVAKPASAQIVEKAIAGPDIKALQFYNGLGGFTPDGREYVISTTLGQTTPVPWINVLANAHFGTVVSESGQAYTWMENAHEFRLTPWNNDPVTDAAGEVFYIRDEENGVYWSPVPLPARGASPYTTRHGFGYTTFEHTENGIHSEMQVFVDLEAAVKFTVIRIKNHSGHDRKLSVTGYVEWVLGDLRPKSAMHIVTYTDAVTGALFARNPYNTEFGHPTCFFDVNSANRTLTADRTEFVGRNGSLRNPDALSRLRLSGKTGAALDPCGVLQVTIDLADGAEEEIVFLLGAASDNQEASDLVTKFKSNAAAKQALERIRAYWQKTLGALQVKTPDPAFDVMANGWLLYQTLVCRITARSGYYQSGGAFGFRDQLQDSLALLHADPAITRQHLLLFASRQFREGDVQHWWHPPLGRGVRTRCSDDYLWLPFVAARYIAHTGDVAILDESMTFLEGRPLNPGEESYYDLPGRSGESATLYEHCVRAIRHGLRFGEHGLPLMGSGDWNDGMDKVGEHGKGESIWLGWFLYTVLARWQDIARQRGEESFALSCAQEAETLKRNIDQHGWDGEWYRRAYFDDGTPLGSASNAECRIDSIAQSWSVLSGAGEAGRVRMAMASADKHLVRRDIGLIQLLDPPFDTSDLNPGYIKGYLPGVRENGGQYTHSAIWLTMAFSAMGEHDKAWELFRLINPVQHGNTPEHVATYKVEPYVMAADVYTLAQHRGRGGWTWYTGSAGWMYQLVTESLLGLVREGDTLRMVSALPTGWDSCEVRYQHKTSWYIIQLRRGKTSSLTVDGNVQPGNNVPLIDDGKEHKVEVICL